MGVHYPRDSRAHRDCVLGVSFLIATCREFPKVRTPLPGIAKVLPTLREIHQTLWVGKLPSGSARDIARACDDATEWGAAYDDKWSPAEQYAGWLRMWFMGYYAFLDAYATADSWVAPKIALWRKAKIVLDRISTMLELSFPKEAADGCRIWCAHVSPYHHEELEDWIQ